MTIGETAKFPCTAKIGRKIAYENSILPNSLAKIGSKIGTLTIQHPLLHTPRPTPTFRRTAQKFQYIFRALCFPCSRFSTHNYALTATARFHVAVGFVGNYKVKEMKF